MSTIFLEKLPHLSDRHIFKKHCKITNTAVDLKHYSEWQQAIHSKEGIFKEDIESFQYHIPYLRYCESRGEATSIKSFLYCMLFLERQIKEKKNSESAGCSLLPSIMCDESVISKPPVITRKTSETPTTPEKRAVHQSDTNISSPSKISSQEITTAALVPPILTDESVIFKPPVITRKTSETPTTPQKRAVHQSDTNIASPSKIPSKEITTAALVPPILTDESVIFKSPVITRKTSETPTTPEKRAVHQSNTNISSPSKIPSQEITSAALVPTIMPDVIDLNEFKIWPTKIFVNKRTKMKIKAPLFLDTATFFAHHQSLTWDTKANIEDTDRDPKVSPSFQIHEVRYYFLVILIHYPQLF